MIFWVSTLLVTPGIVMSDMLHHVPPPSVLSVKSDLFVNQEADHLPDFRGHALDFLGGDLLNDLIGFPVNDLDDDLVDLLVDGEPDPVVERLERLLQRPRLPLDLLPAELAHRLRLDRLPPFRREMRVLLHQHLGHPGGFQDARYLHTHSRASMHSRNRALALRAARRACLGAKRSAASGRSPCTAFRDASSARVAVGFRISARSAEMLELGGGARPPVVPSKPEKVTSSALSRRERYVPLFLRQASSCSTDLGFRLACASIAVLDCSRIESFVYSTICAALLASRIRDF